ncbi:hypothetical protein JW926_08910 [Candidatus Sumerlaeota bacterium]|nr:hypothetical protein [Candidatus Sumerlaeota bacterium]
MIEFDYRKEQLRTGEVIFRPVAKVYLLRNQNEWIAEYFYIDSGADYTLVPYKIGKFLGLEKNASEVNEIGGIGGVIAVRFARISMMIEKYKFDCTLAWSQIESVPFLLGRHDVFDHFDITFKQKSKKTVFVWSK